MTSDMQDTVEVPAAKAADALVWPWSVTFEGRIGRLHYLIATLILSAMNFGLIGLQEKLPNGIAWQGMTFCLLMLVFLIELSFDVRRLHDLTISGHAIWVGAIIVIVAELAAPGWSVALRALDSWGWRLLLVLIPGSRDANKFGPSLRSPTNETAV